ncbi:unnamed protein product [Aphanomyces euteiches]
MDAQLILAATTASAILGAFLIRYLLQPHPLDKLPGPKARSFLFGHALDSIGSVADWRNNDTYPEPYLKWAHEYGGAYHIRELGMHVLQLTDPKAIQHVLITNAPNYSRDTLFDSYFSDIMFGNGLLSTNGAAHDGMRKILTPLFTTSRIKTFLPIFVNQTKRFCDQLPCDKAINMAEAFQKLTLGVIALAAFGFDFDAHPEAFEAFQASQLEFTPFTLIGIFLIPNFLRWPLPQLLRRRKAHNVLKKVMQDVINQKLTAPTKEATDLLDLILPSATENEALVHTMTFMTAGHETTSTALQWIFPVLSSQPKAVARIRDEYARVMAQHGSLESWEAVGDLKYTLAVIQEVMRLHAVAYALIQRIAQGDDQVPLSDGTSVFLPKDTAIELNIATINRNPKYWTNAGDFIPERFIEGTDAWNADLALRDGKSHTFYYFPFSLGSMSCMGQKFALVELQIIVSTVASTFDFNLTPNANLRHQFTGIAMRPVNPEMKFNRFSPCA